MADELDGQRCVYCGVHVLPVDVDMLAELGMPAACEQHEVAVFDEVENGASMWPSGWYGHAWKSSGDSTWRYDEWKPESQK